MEIWKQKSLTDSYKTAELRYFTYIINPHTLKLVGNVKDKTVLDVGCGFGRHLEVLSKDLPLKLVGCDISENLIETCRQTMQNRNIEFYVLDFSDAVSSEIVGHDKYDIVYSACVMMFMETLDKLKTFIKNCYKCLKPNGTLVVSTLDFAKASSYPEICDIIKVPMKPLTENNEYTDGCAVQMEFLGHTLIHYQRNFETLKQLMEEAGFKNIRKYDLFLDDIVLEGFTAEELSIIKKSERYLFFKAEKL